MSRLSRLTAILTLLQTKRLITATEMADKFGVSVRTIYRDVQALVQSGVPIVTEEGKGYSIMEHYRLPPVMFTERQANALVLVEQLVLKNKDASLIADYLEALEKVKAVLKHQVKDRAALLSDRTRFDQILNGARTSNNLSNLQLAITHYRVAKISYTNERNEASERFIEPFALLSTDVNWLLVAWCRLRNGFRYFRLDRISNLEVLAEAFTPHGITLQEFFERYH